jgi:hypothetical protein
MYRKVSLKIFIIVTVSKNKKRGWFKAVVIDEFTATFDHIYLNVQVKFLQLQGR